MSYFVVDSELTGKSHLESEYMSSEKSKKESGVASRNLYNLLPGWLCKCYIKLITLCLHIHCMCTYAGHTDWQFLSERG